MKSALWILTCVAPVYLLSTVGSMSSAQVDEHEQKKQVELDDSIKHLEWLVGRWIVAHDNSESVADGDWYSFAVFRDLTIRPSEDGRALVAEYDFAHSLGMGEYFQSRVRETFSIRDGGLLHVEFECLDKDGKQTSTTQSTRAFDQNEGSSRFRFGGNSEVPQLLVEKVNSERKRILVKFDYETEFDGNRSVKATLKDARELMDSLEQFEWLVGSWESDDRSEEFGGKGDSFESAYFRNLTFELSDDRSSIDVHYEYQYVNGNKVSLFRRIHEGISVSENNKYHAQVKGGVAGDTGPWSTKRDQFGDDEIIVGGLVGVPLLILKRVDSNSSEAIATFSVNIKAGEREFRTALKKVVVLDESLMHLEWLIGRWKPIDGEGAIGIIPHGDHVGAGFRNLTVQPSKDGKSLLVTYIYRASDLHPFDLERRMKEEISASGDNEYKIKLEHISPSIGKTKEAKEVLREKGKSDSITLGGEFRVPVLRIYGFDKDEKTVNASFKAKIRGLPFGGSATLKRVE